MDDQHEKRLKDRLRFAGEKIPSMKRRSEDHDYHSKRFYMITLVVKERYALLGRLVGNAEKAVMRAVLNEGLPLVFLTPWGFNSFSKPGHQYYEACAEGRFLILAPWEHQNERVNLTRAMCLELNEMAQELVDS